MENRIINRFKTYLEQKQLSNNTIAAYLLDIKTINQFSVKKILENFTTSQEDISNYIFFLKNENFSLSKINRIVSSVNIFNSFLFEEKIVPIKVKIESPLKKEDSSKDNLVIFTRAEIEKILAINTTDFSSLRSKAILELVYSIGIKATDCINLLKDDVNLSIGYIKYTGKNNTYHTVPLNEFAIKAIENYLQYRIEHKIEGNYLFTASNGEKLSRQSFWKIFKNREKELSLDKELNPTNFRNSLAIHLLEDGISAEDVKDVLGLSSISSLVNYINNLDRQPRINRILKNHPRNSIK